MERSGTSDKGTITALYTVLVEGDDENEPIADTVRGILDGHIWLSRDLAARGHYPAIEVGRSVSRVMSQVTSPDQRAAASRLRETLATFKEAEDLINIGAYAEGSNPRIDEARRLIEPARAFLRQGVHEQSSMDTTRRRHWKAFSPMKAFKFRLQSVLEQRERRETLAKQTFAEAQAALGRGEQLLGEMREVRQALLEELCRRRAGASTPSRRGLYQDYMQVITQSIAEQEGYVRDLVDLLRGAQAAPGRHVARPAGSGSVRDRHQQAHAADRSAGRAERDGRAGDGALQLPAAGTGRSNREHMDEISASPRVSAKSRSASPP